MVRQYRQQRDRLALLPRYRAIVTHSTHMQKEYINHGLHASRVFNVRYGPDPDSIVVTFKETLNQQFLANCATNHTGTTTPCEDFFTFDFSSFAPLVITDNGNQYLVSFQLANFVNSFFDPSTGTVFTGENTTSQVDVQMAITKIPEPATLVLLGIGLMGVWVAAVARRRWHQRTH